MALTASEHWRGDGWYAINIWMGDRYKWVDQDAVWYETPEDFPILHPEVGEKELCVDYYGAGLYPNEPIEVYIENMPDAATYWNWEKIRKIVEGMTYERGLAYIATCNADLESAFLDPASF